MIDAALGKGRGAAAFRAAIGSGLLARLDEPGRAPRFGVWTPFEEPLRTLLAGVQLVERPEPEGPVPPDRGAFAFAVLLGQLAQRAPRRTADGPLFKRDEEELEALFAPALGAGNVATFVAAAQELGLAFVEEVGAQGRGSRRVRLDPEAAEAFLALPRGARVRRLATAFPIPRWLSAAFSAGGRFVPIGALTAARRLDVAWGPLQGEGESDWLAFPVAAGVLEERERGSGTSWCPLLRKPRSGAPSARSATFWLRGRRTVRMAGSWPRFVPEPPSRSAHPCRIGPLARPLLAPAPCASSSTAGRSCSATRPRASISRTCRECFGILGCARFALRPDITRRSAMSSRGAPFASRTRCTEPRTT